MTDEPDIAPEGTMLLEPRDMFDKAYLGVVNQGGMFYAVYSREQCIDLIYGEIVADKTTSPAIFDGPESDPYTDAVEHFEFNVSGSIGVGYPVFWSGPPTWEEWRE